MMKELMDCTYEEHECPGCGRAIDEQLEEGEICGACQYEREPELNPDR